MIRSMSGLVGEHQTVPLDAKQNRDVRKMCGFLARTNAAMAILLAEAFDHAARGSPTRAERPDCG